MDIQPTIPLRLANAYGVEPVRPAPLPPRGESATKRGSDLVATTVDVRVGDDAVLRQSDHRPDRLAFYSRPSDRHAAATMAYLNNVGRTLDTSG